MKITHIQVNNFRLLEDIFIKLEDDITLVVGSNNSGKSSVADICIDFLEKQNDLKFVDFSKTSYPKFREAYMLYQDFIKSKNVKKDEKIILEKKKKFEDTTPKIILEIHLEYDKARDNLTSLSTFVMDLDTARNDATISIEFSADDPSRIFMAYENANREKATDLLVFLNENIRTYYSNKLFAIDKTKKEYRRLINQDKKNVLERIFLTRSITAQRSVDDNSKDNKKSLGKGFERYYKHTKPNDGKLQIEASLKTLSEQLEKDYNNLFKGIVSDLSSFGGQTPTKIPPITIKSIFDSKNVLDDNINYFYDNGEEILLPENYNGLGYSNLIFMVLQFASFFEEFKNKEPKPEILFIILEEPEAHMHPQMQQVFIKNINAFLKAKGAFAQVILTTHSSHIMAESGIDDKKGFDRIRYFDKTKKKLEVKDLSQLKIDKDEELTKQFLKQYLTIYKCDLFFADKVIIVEGPTERMLLPQMIKKISEKLKHEYISIMEVGGFYSHCFKELLEFINVKTLNITDIDSIDPANKRKACPVISGKSFETANPSLKHWLPKESSIDKLLNLKEAEKITTNQNIRVAFQIPEKVGDKCGRSLEEAIILKNAKLFSNNKKLLTSQDCFKFTEAEIIKGSYEIAENVVSEVKKTGFTFDLLLVENWEVPLYISEGLRWLETKEEEKEPLKISNRVASAVVAEPVTAKPKKSK